MNCDGWYYFVQRLLIYQIYIMIVMWSLKERKKEEEEEEKKKTPLVYVACDVDKRLWYLVSSTNVYIALKLHVGIYLSCLGIRSWTKPWPLMTVSHSLAKARIIGRLQIHQTWWHMNDHFIEMIILLWIQKWQNEVKHFIKVINYMSKRSLTS